MTKPLELLREQLTLKLADPEKHDPILKAVLEIIEEKGSKGLKIQVQQWIADIKGEEGLLCD